MIAWARVVAEAEELQKQGLTFAEAIRKLKEDRFRRNDFEFALSSQLADRVSARAEKRSGFLDGGEARRRAAREDSPVFFGDAQKVTL